MAPYSYSVILIFLNKTCVLRNYDIKSRLGKVLFVLNDLGLVYFLMGNQGILNFNRPLSLLSFTYLWNILDFMELSLLFSFVSLKIFSLCTKPLPKSSEKGILVKKARSDSWLRRRLGHTYESHTYECLLQVTAVPCFWSSIPANAPGR